MVTIEEREHQEPVWEEFTWEVWGQRIQGVMSELPGDGYRSFKRVRVAISVPQDAENVTLRISTRNRIDHSPRETRRISEECYTISYWSRAFGVGQLIVIPRELAQRQDQDLPVTIVVERVDVFSLDQGGKPTYKNL